MYRFKYLSLVIVFSCLAASLCLAESSGEAKIEDYDASTHWGVSLGYVSWQESLTLQSGASKDYGNSNFSGNSLYLSRESYFERAPRHGIRYVGGINYGVATAGGTQPLLSYQFSNLAWTGEYLSALYVFQISPTITLGAGPFILARQISYQTLTNGTTATSGSSINFGEEADLRLELVKHWNLRFQMANLSTNAGMLWDFSIGYLF